MIRFEDQQLISFSGLLLFQQLFKQIDLKARLKECFVHLKTSPIFGRHLVVILLIIHLLIGFRRLREVDYYQDDPIVLRLMGLRSLPDDATISRALSQMENDGVENVRKLLRSMVIEGLQRERLSRITMDFDGSVQSTKGHAQGTAVGYNKSNGNPNLGTAHSVSYSLGKRPKNSTKGLYNWIFSNHGISITITRLLPPTSPNPQKA